MIRLLRVSIIHACSFPFTQMLFTQTSDFVKKTDSDLLRFKNPFTQMLCTQMPFTQVSVFSFTQIPFTQIQKSVYSDFIIPFTQMPFTLVFGFLPNGRD